MNPLRLETRRVLLKEWDPIGVQDIEEAEDEYDAYADGVWRMLLRGMATEDIAAYLHQTATDYMGLRNFRYDRSAAIAVRLKQLAAAR